jgi:alkylation response protein AidB-like acyl-CoA dehydrogenase
LSEVAFQQALSFSKSRKQGRNNEKDPLDGTAIINHPDIKRQLLTMKSLIEGERALAFWLSIQTDLSLKEKNLQKKEEASDLVALMTPGCEIIFYRSRQRTN